MDIYCYAYSTPELTLLGVVDDFESFNYEIKYSNVGDWELELNGYSKNAQRVRNADIIAYKNFAGIITDRDEEIDEKGYTITFKGKELKYIAYNRIVLPPTGKAYLQYSSKTAGYIIQQLIDTQIINPTDTDRKIEGSIVDVSTNDTKIDYSGRFDVVGEDIVKLATTYNIGWNAYVINGSIHWNIYSGIDRSATQSENSRAIFDYNYGTMYYSELQEAKTNPTFCLVAGQGEGVDRTTVNVDFGNTNFTRIETYVDGRDEEDASKLPQKGNEELSSYGDPLVYTASLSNAAIKRVGEDFDIGDTATVRDNNFNASFDVIISGIEYNYESGKDEVKLTFGYDMTDLKSAIERSKSKTQALISAEGGSKTLTVNVSIAVDDWDSNLQKTIENSSITSTMVVLGYKLDNLVGVLTCETSAGSITLTSGIAQTATISGYIIFVEG